MHRRDTTTGRIRGTTPKLDQAARRLRQTMTPAEQTLWQALRRRQLDGLAFRRQHPLGPFVVDFCCPARRLIVELDGAVHDLEDVRLQDQARTDILASHGYRVIRFRNHDVSDDLPSVLARIVEEASLPPPPFGTLE